MKLIDLVPETMRRMDKYIVGDKFRLFLSEGKRNHWYTKNYSRWAVAMCRDAIYHPVEICDIYRKYKCNDDHIYTLIHHCMKAKGWLDD